MQDPRTSATSRHPVGTHPGPAKATADLQGRRYERVRPNAHHTPADRYRSPSWARPDRAEGGGR